MSAVTGEVPAPAAATGPAVARHLELRFRAEPRGRSYLHRQYVRYPFHLTRPFYLDRPHLPGLATLYLQSASGGLYAGDSLDTAIAVEAGAAAHVTTQASTIVHRSHRGAGAMLRTELRLEPGAFLALTPDPTILFADAELESLTRAWLAEDASLVLGEAMLGHDPRKGQAGGAPGPVRRYLSAVEIAVAGLGRAVDRQAFAAMSVPAALDPDGRFLAQAALYCIGPAFREGGAERLLAGLAPPPGCIWGADLLPAGLGTWARVLAPSGHQLTAAMTALFDSAFCMQFGTAPAPRRK